MKKVTIANLSAALVLLAAAANSSRADWSYVTTSPVPAISSGTGSVQLTGESAGTSAASIAILGIQDSSTATAGTPDAYNSPFKVAVTFTDTAKGDSGTLTLTGLLKGSLTANSSNVTASFGSPQSLTLDGHTYTVNVPTLTLSAPGQPQQNLMANVTVANAPTGNNVTPNIQPHLNIKPLTSVPSSGTPEPTSLVLGSLGWSLLGVGSWWNRRRQPMLPRA